MTSETARTEAFSDGVFAIAITLLILEIKVPHTQPGGLGRALLSEWPSYLAFFLSFAFIGIMWINHHRLFIHIRRADSGLKIFNLLLLMGVTFLPFPTEVLAEYLNSAADRRAAALFFNGTYFVIAIFFNLLWHYAVRKRLVDQSASASAAMISKQYAVGPIAYGACFLLAAVSVRASVGLNIALAIFFAVPPELLDRNSRSRRHHTEP